MVVLWIGKDKLREGKFKVKKKKVNEVKEVWIFGGDTGRWWYVCLRVFWIWGLAVNVVFGIYFLFY